MPAPFAAEDETANRAPLGTSITNSPCPGIKAGIVTATISANNILYGFSGMVDFDNTKTIKTPMRHHIKML